jgi:L-threonylcarbamoyladenylate synthase
MQTTLYRQEELDNPKVLEHLRAIILRGGLVVFPTETVYGIGGNALDGEASRRIYAVKGRPSDNPLIVHIETPEELHNYVASIPKTAEVLIRRFWPGPLTLILKKRPIVPDQTTAGLDTVAIRCPSHPAAQALIRACGVPIAAPSANISGRPSSTTFAHVVADLSGLVDAIIDGGDSPIGLESTVLDLTSQTPTILRPGSITKSMLETALGQAVLDASAIRTTNAPRSPGMKYTHYAPQGEVVLLYGEMTAIATYANREIALHPDLKTAVICATDYAPLFTGCYVLPIGLIDAPEEVAKHLFSALREMDERHMKRIFIHAFSESEIGAAIMNRLLKAAGYKTVKVDA